MSEHQERKQTYVVTNGNRYVTYKAAWTGLGAFLVLMLTVCTIARAIYLGEQDAQDRLADDRWTTHIATESERANSTEIRLKRIEDKLDDLRDRIGP